jgi:cation diffusion facilitator CzcD-associated flavoprotein CzcO
MADIPSSFLAGGPETLKRLDGPINAERHVKVICVGAGASGLLLAYKVQKHFKNISLAVYEKNPAVAGTWYENRYPGYVYVPHLKFTKLLVLSWEKKPEQLGTISFGDTKKKKKNTG